MIDFSQRMIDVQSKVTGEPKDGWGINEVIKRHLELEIRTLQNVPRDAEKLRRLLEIKHRQKDEAMRIEDTQRLVAEIEMLEVVLFLVSRKQQSNNSS
jgi:hypothetical protein